MLHGAIGAVVVVVLIDTVLAVELDALEVLPHDEVHHTGDSVRAVHGRRATRDDFDVINHRGGNLIEVGTRQHVIAGHQPLAVDQHEGAGATEVSQIHRGCTDRAVRLIGAEIGKGGG